MNIAIVGAGFSGVVVANKLASNGHTVDLFESRNHIGGNCFTERDPETGIMVHKYGPHIFHTDNKKIWDFINSYAKMVPYINRVKTTTRGEVFSLPVNLHTINQFFKQTFNPEEAKSFLDSLTKDFINLEPISFQDQALKFVGSELYSAFFKGYTLKQWGIAPEDLPASILKRLPLRFNYDDNYFNHQFQGIPENGYTEIFEKLIDHRNINLHLNSNFQQSDKSSFAHVFFTGPIDAWFNHKFGKLGYRTLDFESVVADGDYQGCAVMNYPEIQVPHTRITEHKHFTPWESHSKTIVFREFSRECEEGDIPYYPIRLVSEKEQLREYVNAAREELNVSFLGRLGTYRYLDMDVTINEALKSAEIFEKCIVNKVKIPVFFTDEIL